MPSVAICLFASPDTIGVLHAPGSVRIGHPMHAG